MRPEARRRRKVDIDSGSAQQKGRIEREGKERVFGKLRDELYDLYVRIRRLEAPDYQPNHQKRDKDKEKLLDLALMLTERDIEPIDYMSFVANCCDNVYPSFIASEGLVASYESGTYQGEENHFAHLQSLEDSAEVMDEEFVLWRGIRQGNDPLALHLFALSHGFDIEKPRKLKEDAATCWLLTSKKQRDLIKLTVREAAEAVIPESHWSFDAVSWLAQLFGYESLDDIREALGVSDSADHELGVVGAWGYGKGRLRCAWHAGEEKRNGETEGENLTMLTTSINACGVEGADNLLGCWPGEWVHIELEFTPSVSSSDLPQGFLQWDSITLASTVLPSDNTLLWGFKEQTPITHFIVASIGNLEKHIVINYPDVGEDSQG